MPEGSHVPPPAILKPRKRWTGSQLLSLCLPSWLTNDSCYEKMDMDKTVIRQG